MSWGNKLTSVLEGWAAHGKKAETAHILSSQLALGQDSRDASPGLPSTLSLLPFHKSRAIKGGHVFFRHMTSSQGKLMQKLFIVGV
jgi:hypothetical protein